MTTPTADPTLEPEPSTPKADREILFATGISTPMCFWSLVRDSRDLDTVVSTMLRLNVSARDAGAVERIVSDRTTGYYTYEVHLHDELCSPTA